MKECKSCQVREVRLVDNTQPRRVVSPSNSPDWKIRRVDPSTLFRRRIVGPIEYNSRTAICPRSRMLSLLHVSRGLR